MPQPLSPPRSTPTFIDERRCNLETALQLLQQSGHAWPDRLRVGASAWLQAVVDGLCELSSRDALTGLANRRQFELALAQRDRSRRARRRAGAGADGRHRPLQARQRRARPPGRRPRAARRSARALHDCIRPMDTVARFGGEEFAMILPNCAPSFGQTVAERDPHSRSSARTVAIAPGQASRRDGQRSAARSRRSGCARRRRCGSSAPTSSSTAPRPKAATAPASSSRRSRTSAPRKRACCSAPRSLRGARMTHRPRRRSGAHPRGDQRQGRRRQDVRLGQPRGGAGARAASACSCSMPTSAWPTSTWC